MKPFLLAVSTIVLAAGPASAQSDADIRQQIVRQSVAAYPGACACPYNRDRAGRMCGRRSAYSRPGGHAPICYPADVTPAQIQAWRRAQR